MAPDPLNGWGNLILQGGAFVLLAYIIVVMVPKILGEMRVEREARDQNFTRLMDALQDRFDSRNAVLAQSIRDQTDSFRAQIEKQTVVLEKALSAVCRGGRG